MKRGGDDLIELAQRRLNAASGPVVHFRMPKRKRGHRIELESRLGLVLPGGAAAFLEFTAPGERLTPEQQGFRYWAEQAGAKVAVCSSFEDLDATLVAWGLQLDGGRA